MAIHNFSPNGDPKTATGSTPTSSNNGVAVRKSKCLHCSATFIAKSEDFNLCEQCRAWRKFGDHSAAAAEALRQAKRSL